MGESSSSERDGFRTIDIVSVAPDTGATRVGSMVTEKTFKKANLAEEAHRSGCMVCGTELIYLETDQDTSCHYCGRVLPANARCLNGHFVCDDCHRADAVEIISQVCLSSTETDAVTLMQIIRSHAHFRIHGPEHHSLVPAVILTVFRNDGGAVTDDQIVTAIQRGQTVIGGACAFLGACGAAIGVGIAVSLILGASPYDGDKRQAAQRAIQRVLGVISRPMMRPGAARGTAGWPSERLLHCFENGWENH